MKNSKNKIKANTRLIGVSVYIEQDERASIIFAIIQKGIYRIRTNMHSHLMWGGLVLQLKLFVDRFDPLHFCFNFSTRK